MSRFRHHLDDCPDCLALVMAAIKEKSPDLATTLPGDLAGGSRRVSVPRLPSNLLLAGAQVGPYVIERLIGAGGMGVVYAARDSRLDRTVALKLIRREVGVREA